MGGAVHGIFELPDARVECDLAAPCLLTEAAAAAGVILNVACGGKGNCGGCAVELLAGRFAAADGAKVPVNSDNPPRVLSCQTRLVGGDFHLRVPRRSLVEAGEKVVMDFAYTPAFSVRPRVRKEHLQLDLPDLSDQRGHVERIADELRRRDYEATIAVSAGAARSAELVARADYDVTVTLAQRDDALHLIAIQPGDTTGTLYGAAVDVGTTTVVVALVDLLAGRIVDAASSYNQQITRCDNVASRISYADTPERLTELHDLVVGATVNRLLGMLTEAHGIAAGDVAHMTVSGNSVMTHLFCGVSPASLGGVPFAPVSNFFGPYRAGELGIAMNREAFVDLAPSVRAYVGGDITSDLYVCGLHAGDELVALIDIGTNAEIVVGSRSRSLACAAPAGPAFEGHGLTSGMRAAAGAIESFALDSLEAEPTYVVIGGARPAGICGSGLIDFLAAAYRAGVITQVGRFSPEALEKCPRIRTVRQDDRELAAYEIVPGTDTEGGAGPVVITERDIAALLQAKGVIRAALEIAIKNARTDLDKIHRIYLAGGFAKHIDLDNAVSMGLLPDIDRHKYVFIGNGSLAGAFLALVDERVARHLPGVAAAPEVIELNLDSDFQDAYILSMLLPEGT